MKYGVFIPSALLIIGIGVAQFSGNDKAAFLVFSVIGINIIIAFGAIIATFLHKISYSSLLLLILPTVYAILIILLTKYGILDSQIFLGFR